MSAAGCWNLVFSSSCTVYGDTATSPLSESSPLGTPTNAYAATKSMTEFMLKDIARADARWRMCLLRYFNPVGAHPSGRIGEDPNAVNWRNFICRVRVGCGRLAQRRRSSSHVWLFSWRRRRR